MDIVETLYKEFGAEIKISNQHFYNEGYADAVETELKWIPLNKDNFDTFCGEGIICALRLPIIKKFSKKDNDYIFINGLRMPLDDFYKRAEASREFHYFLPLDFPPSEEEK